MPPIPAIARNNVPITSSHSMSKTWPSDRTLDVTAPQNAFRARLRLARCVAICDATRAMAPTFRAVESWLTLSILTVSGATIEAAPESEEPFLRRWHPTNRVGESGG